QSMKSHLASRLFTDTNIYNTFFTLEDLIAIILRALRDAVDRQVTETATTVVVGRPAHFSGAANGGGDEVAVARPPAAVAPARLEDVRCEFEPVAAAYQYEQQLDHDEMVLIGDFGGGTSDFSLIQLGPERRLQGHREGDILGIDGVPIAGDAFD